MPFSDDPVWKWWLHRIRLAFLRRPSLWVVVVWLCGWAFLAFADWWHEPASFEVQHTFNADGSPVDGVRRPADEDGDREDETDDHREPSHP